MKKNSLPGLIFFLLLGLIFLSLERTEAAQSIKGKAKAETRALTCSSCHTDFASLLPPTHPPIKGVTLSACLACHAQGERGKAEPDKFSARLHLAHLKGKIKADCFICHTWKPGKRFGLIGAKESYGAPSEEDMNLMKQLFGSAAESGYLDARHLSKDITCGGCHGKGLPQSGDTVENVRCLECHGPAEELAAKTAPQVFPDRNPHKSHLGEIACTVCHHSHTESKVYCLECHPKFEMHFK
jgi:hypothetical protein